MAGGVLLYSVVSSSEVRSPVSFLEEKKSILLVRMGNSGKYLGLCGENFFLDPPPKNSSNCVVKTICHQRVRVSLGGLMTPHYFSGEGIKKGEELWDPSRLYFIKKWLNVAHHTVAVAGPFFPVLESLSLSIMTLQIHSLVFCFKTTMLEKKKYYKGRQKKIMQWQIQEK